MLKLSILFCVALCCSLPSGGRAEPRRVNNGLGPSAARRSVNYLLAQDLQNPYEFAAYPQDVSQNGWDASTYLQGRVLEENPGENEEYSGLRGIQVTPHGLLIPVSLQQLSNLLDFKTSPSRQPTKKPSRPQYPPHYGHYPHYYPPPYHHPQYPHPWPHPPTTTTVPPVTTTTTVPPVTTTTVPPTTTIPPTITVIPPVDNGMRAPWWHVWPGSDPPASSIPGTRWELVVDTPHTGYTVRNGKRAQGKAATDTTKQTNSKEN